MHRDLSPASGPHIAPSENGPQSTSRQTGFHSSSAHTKGDVFNAEKPIAFKGKHSVTGIPKSDYSTREGHIINSAGCDPGMKSGQITGKKTMVFAKTSEGDDEISLQRQQPAKATQRSGSLVLKNWKEARDRKSVV